MPKIFKVSQEELNDPAITPAGDNVTDQVDADVANDDINNMSNQIDSYTEAAADAEVSLDDLQTAENMVAASINEEPEALPGVPATSGEGEGEDGGQAPSPEVAVAVAQETLRLVAKRLGYEKSTVSFSYESLKEDTISKAKLTREDIKDMASKTWNAIKALWEKIKNIALNLIDRFMGLFGSISKKLEDLEKEAKEMTDKADAKFEESVQKSLAKKSILATGDNKSLMENIVTLRLWAEAAVKDLNTITKALNSTNPITGDREPQRITFDAGIKFPPNGDLEDELKSGHGIYLLNPLNGKCTTVDMFEVLVNIVHKNTGIITKVKDFDSDSKIEEYSKKIVPMKKTEILSCISETKKIIGDSRTATGASKAFLKQVDEKLKVMAKLVARVDSALARMSTILPNSTIVAMNSSIKIAIQYISESIKAHKGGSSESSSDSKADNNNKEGDK